MSAADVPVCAGRGSQPRCKYYKANGSEPVVHWCTALYNVVTGEPLLRDCTAVRGDQMTCGRKGELYDPVDAAPHPYANARERMGPSTRSTWGRAREDLG